MIVEVRDASGADRAGEQGADGIVLRDAAGSPSASSLPLLAYGPSLDEAAGLAADAFVISADGEGDGLVAIALRAAELGIECVVKVRNEDDLERALEHLDPEIFLLSAEDADGDQGTIERLLELLPDVPAGKLAIAEVGPANRGEIEELEHAGVDAVLVAPGDVEQLVGDTLPDDL